ncbi:hypothetical protein FISHEDRAFT_50587 [Fistulina hepatica ATCC 64428]|uniref:Uncharacterized protein n=1 Tax=Fistulina hepatica ATCC 64428 TaxID=1128425 RepID=A0A0D7A4M7_9AGAR|nr:hypothetical protein FISHEDRAFT_50587 [Fistulina hepatica ATCC 64428]
MIIDRKYLQPPPAYSEVPGPAVSRTALEFKDLPPHILLDVVYLTLPQMPGYDDSIPERQRRVLWWLSSSLRLVNRAFYIACMHILRSAYLPIYLSHIQPPYTTDPFPLSSTSYSSRASVQSLQRETQVLDLFIALKVRDDVLADSTSLHLGNDDSFRDIFSLMQPRARLEDLVRKYGVREGAVYVPGSPPETPVGEEPLPRRVNFSALSITFSPRRVGLVFALRGGTKKTIIDVQRMARDETLEVTAKRIARELGSWVARNSWGEPW